MLDLTALFARPVLAPVLAVAAATATLTLAAPASAVTADAVPTAIVRLDAADLSAGDAAATVHDRIAAAARRVCTPDGRTLRDQMNARQCYVRALRSGEVQLVAQREQAKGRQQTLAAAAR